MPATKKSSVKKTVVKKAAPKKVAVKKAPVKIAVKKVAVKKAPVKKAAVKTTVKKPAVTKAIPNGSVITKVTKKAPAKALPAVKGERVEELVTERSMELKSVEEYLGIKDHNRENKPVIPGVFDLLIPPGTPRKIVLKMAKNFNLEVVRRDDIYVPIGVSDVERDVLAFRGDKKTVTKLEKILFKELEDYERTGKVEGFKVIP
jgi:hypothetical protein